MCGRLSQYRGIHDFVAALSMPNALANSVGYQPIALYTVAQRPTLRYYTLQGELLHADPCDGGTTTRAGLIKVE